MKNISKKYFLADSDNAAGRAVSTHTKFAMSAARMLAATFVMFMVAACCVLLCACSSEKQASETSPQFVMDKSSVISSSQLTEESQLVDVTLAFDTAVHAEGDVLADFNITLDDKEIDFKTIALNFETDNEGLLHIRLTPSEKALAGDPQVYFACYQGSLKLAPKNSSGVLAHVLGVDDAPAVMKQEFNCTIPSGVKIKQLSSKKSSFGKYATTKIKVVQSAQIRCCTWVCVGNERFYIHNHSFMRQSPITCASSLAEAISNSSHGAYKAKANGDELTIQAQDENAQAFNVSIYEGVY